MSVRIFEGTNHANIYAQFRPSAPDQVIDVVLDYLRQQIPEDRWRVAVDVGCGSGQGCNKLSQHFGHCYGFDVSPAQITAANTTQHPDNVSYAVCPAESLPTIESNSVQLMTAFQAVHWFDFDSFTTECTRVLCPNGVLAMIGYNYPEPIDPWNPDDRSLVELMYDLYTDERLAPFKNPKIVPLERHYRDIKLPDNYEMSLKDNNWTSKRVAAQDIVGYVQSWSLYQGLQNADRETAELLTQEVIHRLKSILKISKAHADIYVRFRPAVPEEVVDKVVQYLADKLPADVEEDNTNRWSTAVDVGCGSGQGTNAMAKHFANCYGFDVSPAQIEAAIRSTHPSNVCYQVCPAESMPSIETNSVQMVTAFECFQYFDHKKFMEECTRVLVDNGVLAVIGYFIPDPSDPLEPNRDQSLVDLMQECYNSDRLAAYKSPNVASVENHYKNVTFPTNYESKHVDHIIASVPVLAEDMVGLIESWSSFQQLVKADTESAQLFRREIREKLSAILKTNDLFAKEIVFNYTYFIAMA
ncbi:unnamed protein product, partial [Medioppia subpectinata]